MLSIDEANQALESINHKHCFEPIEPYGIELRVICENCKCTWIWAENFNYNYKWYLEIIPEGSLDDYLHLTCEEFKMKEALE